MPNSNLGNGIAGSFFVSTADGDRLLNTHRLAYLKALNRWCEIVKLDGATTVARHSLKEIELRLPGVFLRLDRFHLLNMGCVDCVHRVSRNESVLSFKEAGVSLQIGRAGMSTLRKLKLSNFNLTSLLPDRRDL